jgi:(p)ppGpp synthase/HD superfamily hydrolase
MVLGKRFDAALALAHRVHRRQKRKGTSIPYIAHVLGVTSLVLEYGANEDEATAAVLHDVLEDVAEFGAGLTVDALSREIEARFGSTVLTLVEHMTDTVSHPKPPWPERKALHLKALGQAPPSALLIAAADKLHNVRSLIRDYRSAGEALWERFNPEAGRDRTLGYYRAALELFKARLPGALTDALEREVIALEELVSAGGNDVQRG